MSTPEHLIVFDFPEGRAWAGLDRGGWGFALHASTAQTFTDPDEAHAVLANAYSISTQVYGRVVLRWCLVCFCAAHLPCSCAAGCQEHPC